MQNSTFSKQINTSVTNATFWQCQHRVTAVAMEVLCSTGWLHNCKAPKRKHWTVWRMEAL